MIDSWVTTGDTDHFKETLFPVYDAVATLFSNIVERNGTTWTLTNMTDPVRTTSLPLFPIENASK
jgi:hypothetical protein